MISVNELPKALSKHYSLMLVDRVLELDPSKRAVGIKNVTINEWQFRGHFPAKPILPGVLILEAMVQVGKWAMLCGDENNQGSPFVAGIYKVKFRKPVIPGDQLLIVAEVVQVVGASRIIRAQSFVDSEVVAEGEFSLCM